jgi:hypothetical protein
VNFITIDDNVDAAQLFFFLFFVSILTFFLHCLVKISFVVWGYIYLRSLFSSIPFSSDLNNFFVFVFLIKVHPSSLSIEGTLGNLRLSDMSLGTDHSWGWLCDIRNPGVESLIKVHHPLFDLQLMHCRLRWFCSSIFILYSFYCSQIIFLSFSFPVQIQFV